MICGPSVDFKKLRHWTNLCASRARKEDSFTGHTKQHPLGNSDLKTSSDESSRRVCRMAPPTSCRTSAGGRASKSQSSGVDSAGESTWPLLSFRLAGNRLRPLAGSLPSKSLLPPDAPVFYWYQVAGHELVLAAAHHSPAS